MDLQNVELFKDISHDSVDSMMKCFSPEVRKFKKGDTILVFEQEVKYLCVLLTGKAHLYCVDSEGEYTLLENYGPNDIFGEVFTMPFGAVGYVAEADSDCSVMFMKMSSIYGRCSNACEHHTMINKNLFHLSAKKAQMLALRINMISKKTVRQKLVSYFEYLEEKTGSRSFDTELSLSQLANYLCVDRTSLMRELRLMREEGIIQSSGRRITVL
ncbi:MAG: Crp/Fnr family transcriptional regulator [Oscillospiraceae bacterium]|nr:Crp/Fnr family transcriptional regulator [Oscillospiraceae bacterium]